MVGESDFFFNSGAAMEIDSYVILWAQIELETSKEVLEPTNVL